jgi:hypothetical protein
MDTGSSMHYVRLFFPSARKDGSFIDQSVREDAARSLEDELIQLSRGFTRSLATGGFIHSDGRVIRERVDIFEFFVQSPSQATTLAAKWAALLDQEVLLVAIDGRPFFVAA